MRRRRGLTEPRLGIAVLIGYGRGMSLARNWLRVSTASVPLLAATVGMEAHAQNISPDPVTELVASVEVRHDSNVARADPIRAATRGLVQSDQHATVGTELNIARSLGRNTLQLTAFTGYTFYRHNKQLNSERLSFDGAVGLNAGPCSLQLKPRFERKQSELSSIAIVNAPGTDSVQNVQTTQSYGSELRCGRSIGLGALALYEHARGNNSNPLRKISNNRSDRIGFGAGYSHPIIGQFKLLAERQKVKYPQRVNIGFGGLTGYELKQVQLTASRDIGVVLVADGSVAYNHLRPAMSDAAGFDGLAWKIGLSATPTNSLRVRLDFSKALNPSLGSDALYSRDRELSGSLTYQLSPRTAVSLSASRSKHAYEGASGSVGPLLSNDRLDQYTLGLQFNPSNRLRFRLQAGRELRNANGTMYDYRNSFVALNTRFSLGT